MNTTPSFFHIKNTHPSINSILSCMFSVVILSMLSACGQKGGLYIPEGEKVINQGTDNETTIYSNNEKDRFLMPKIEDSVNKTWQEINHPNTQKPSNLTK